MLGDNMCQCIMLFLRDLLMEDANQSHGKGDTGCWLTHQIQREEAERDPRLRWAGI